MIRINALKERDREKIRYLLKQRNVFTQREIMAAIEVIDEAMRPGNKEYLVFCARKGESLIGFICFGPIPMTDNNYDLYWIVVAEEYSRQGIGRELLLSMEETLIGNKARSIYVETSSGLPCRSARRFYEKNGYSVAGVLNDFYRKGDDKIIYTKALFRNELKSDYTLQMDDGQGSNDRVWR